MVIRGGSEKETASGHPILYRARKVVNRFTVSTKSFFSTKMDVLRCKSEVLSYLPKQRSRAVLIFDVFSTFLEFNAPIKQRWAQDFM